MCPSQSSNLTLHQQIQILRLLRDNWDLRGAKAIKSDLELIERVFIDSPITPSLLPLWNGSVRATIYNGEKVLEIDFPPYAEDRIFFRCTESCVVEGERDLKDTTKLIAWISVISV